MAKDKLSGFFANMSEETQSQGNAVLRRRDTNHAVFLLSAMFALATLHLMLPEAAFAYQRAVGGILREAELFFASILRAFLHPPEPVRWIYCIAGIACLIIGYRFYKFVVMLPGIAIGGLLGYAIGYSQGGTGIGLLGALILGLIGGSIAWFFHQFAIWLVGAFLGGLLVAAVAGGVFETSPHPILVLIGALMGGGILLAISKGLVIVKSSLFGALLVSIGFGKLGNLAFFLISFVFGVLAQYGVMKVLMAKGVSTIAAGAVQTGALAGLRNKGKTSLVKPAPALGSAPVAGTAHTSRQITLWYEKLKSTEEEMRGLIREGKSVVEILDHYADTHAIPHHFTRDYLLLQAAEQ